MGIQITVHVKGFREASDAFERGVKNGLNRAVAHVTQVAQRNAPVKSGNLRRSIHAGTFSTITSSTPGKAGVLQGGVGGGFTGSIIQDGKIAKYGKWVERGTGLYGPSHTPIVPKTAAYLVWRSNGKWYRKRSVKGMRPQPFMRPAFEDAKVSVKRIFKESIDEALSRYN